MLDRGQRSVALRRQPQALDRVGPMRGDMKHLLPRQRELDRSVHHPGREGGENGVGLHRQFRSESAADVAADEPDLLLRDLQGRRHRRDASRQHLVGRVEGQRVVVPYRDGGVRLHHRVALRRRRVGHVDFHRRGRESLVHVAHPAVGLVAVAGLRHERFGHRRRHVVGAFFGGVGRFDQMSRGARLFECLRHHQRDGLSVVQDLVVDELRRAVLGLWPLFRGILVCQGQDDARRLFGRGRIDCSQPTRRDAGFQQEGVGGRADVPILVGVGRVARDLERAVHAVERPSEQTARPIERGFADGRVHADHVGVLMPREWRPTARPRPCVARARS